MRILETIGGARLATLSVAVIVALWSFSATAEDLRAQQAEAARKSRAVVIPLPDPEYGKQLFAGKGCVICHSINGVGGKAAPALDAAEEEPYANPFEFAARMWRGAEQMILLQQMDFGYQIELTGDELADLAAFAQDKSLQSQFSEADVPDVVKDWIMTEPYDDIE